MLSLLTTINVRVPEEEDNKQHVNVQLKCTISCICKLGVWTVSKHWNSSILTTKIETRNKR